MSSFFSRFLAPDSVQKYSEYILLGLVAFLPFHTIISVFFTYQIGIGGVNFFKEFLLVVLLGAGTWLAWSKRYIPRLDTLDKFILTYMFVMIVITGLNGHGLSHLIYGGRYDFEFLVAFLIVRHILPLLHIETKKVITLFLISGGIAIVLGMVVRFLFGETILLYFGFSDSASNWSFDGAPPMYHGVAHASVVRFQGIFDGPNQAAYFLLVYIGAFAHRFFPKKGYDVFAGMVVLILIYLLIVTYSRSAYLGLMFGTVVGVVATISGIIETKFGQLPIREKYTRGASYLYRKYKTLIIGLCVAGMVVVGGFLLANWGKMGALIAREGSTYGHIERFVIGVLRFADKPFGAGLGTSGPASRSLYEVDHTDTEFVSPSERVQSYLDTAAGLNEHHEFTSESYYIPESWYIQQLVEGGIIGLAFFLVIMWIIFWRLFWSHPWICASFAGVLVMNLVLHTFESMYTSLILFMLIACLLPRETDTTTY